MQAGGVVSAARLKESGGPGSRSAFEGGNQGSPYVAGMTLVCLVLFLFFLSLSVERSKHLWTWPHAVPVFLPQERPLAALARVSLRHTVSSLRAGASLSSQPQPQGTRALGKY